MFIDSHAHLDGPRFSEDRTAVLRRARAAGVEALLLIGSGDGPGTLDCAIRLVEEFSSSESPELYASVGVHPHEAAKVRDEHYDELTRLARHERVVGWGEIGLDYFYDHSPREVQQQVFARQMELARAAVKPIIIHCRPSQNSDNAWQDCLALVRKHWAASGRGGVLHCFTGEWEHAQAALEMGFYVSFAGNVTFAKAENIRDAARRVPADRLLVETDSPYLAPVPHRGERNEPAFVIATARYVAGLRGVSEQELAAATAANFRRLFGIVSAS
jgi:TatD DNase family protein